MEPQIPRLNSLVVEKIFSYLHETEKDQQTFRLINKLWLTESLKLWRKSATVVIQLGLTYRGEQLINNFLKEFNNICEDNDPHNLINLSFRRYKIINPHFNFLPSCGEYPCSRYYTRPPREFSNFWRISASHMSHLEITNCPIHNKKCLINLLSSLLLEQCPSLKKLYLTVGGSYSSNDKVSLNEVDNSASPSSRSCLSLETFGLGTPRDHFPFLAWGMPILKRTFALFPKIKELQLEETAVQMLKALKYPVTPTGEYIKLEKVVIKIKDSRNFRLEPFSFSSLKEYVEAVNPPLNQLEANVYLKDIRNVSSYNFHSFFSYWGSHLTHLVLNIDLKDNFNGLMDNHFTDLSGRNFQELTNFQLTFLNDSNNISFDFKALRGMPKLKVFWCNSDVFINDFRRIRRYRHLDTADGIMEWRHSINKQLEYSGTTHDWNRNISSGENIGGNEERQLFLDHLTDFSFRLNYKFGKESLQNLKTWAGNIRNLEIVVDNEQMFLDFLGKEFQWWPHSLDKLVLHCEADLDTEEIKKAIRGEERRPVEIHFSQLEIPPYPNCMYRYA